MTREAFLAASGLDKRAEMESVAASPLQAPPRAPWLRGRAVIASSLPKYRSPDTCRAHTFAQGVDGRRTNVGSISNSNLQTRYGRYDVVEPIGVDLSHSHSLENLRFQREREKLSSEKIFQPFKR